MPGRAAQLDVERCRRFTADAERSPAIGRAARKERKVSDDVGREWSVEPLLPRLGTGEADVVRRIRRRVEPISQFPGSDAARIVKRVSERFVAVRTDTGG